VFTRLEYLSGPTRRRVAQADLDRAVRVADPVAAAHSRALRGDRPVPEAEAAREALGVEVQALDQLSRGVPDPSASSFLHIRAQSIDRSALVT
jgi:hypothetical protein